MMICTAGHVDHGKTSLVKMLTGCMTSRLKEELERGLTIELGFAPCFLGGDLCAGIVDVPGHERFIRNMVAGVSGIGLAVLCIAADDGIMPQTVEHMEIMSLMGVRHGMVALTKTDLVAPERVPERVAEIAAWLKGTFLEGAPICPVSSETFEGYPEFYETLVARIKGLRHERREGVFRMPVERAFARPGFGAVVTGIPVEGRLRIGEAVECVPGGGTGHIRGMQCFLRDATEGGAGQCLALNIPEYGKRPPERGDVLCAPGWMRAVSMFHVRLSTVPGLPQEVRNAAEVVFHSGTAECPGRLYLLEEKTLASGASALATVVVSRAVAAAAFDRFILRQPSPANTIGGGRILIASDAPQRPKRAEILARLQAFEAFFAGADPEADEGRARRVEYALLHAPASALSAEDAARAAMQTVSAARECLDRLVAAGRAAALDGGLYVHAEQRAVCRAALDARLAAAAQAGELSLSVNELRQGFNWPPALWADLRTALEREGKIRVQGDRLLLHGSVDALPPADREMARRVIDLFDRTAYASPHPDELPALLGAPEPVVRRIVQFLAKQGEIFKVADNVILSHRHLKAAQDLVVDTCRARGTISSQEFRDRLQTTRKYAIAILEFLDLRRVTLRVQNDRKLMPGYERNLV